MIISKMIKFIFNTIFLNFLFFNSVFAIDNFDDWVKNFQIKAVKSGISKKVVVEIMSNAKFLPKVIEYDRYQPEFYEDTLTYIKKRSSNRKIKEGLKLYSKEKKTIENIEKEFQVEKELLLALMELKQILNICRYIISIIT